MFVLQMSRAAPDAPRVVWGGLLPSGSLKVLTFERYFGRIEGLAQMPGLVEASGGCTALALEHLSLEAGLPLVVVTTPAGQQNLRAHGYRGETVVRDTVSGAMAFCAERAEAGWHWPQQMSNPSIVPAVEAWAPDLARLLRTAPNVDTIITGFGTGATLIGLRNALEPLGYRVIGVESPPDTTIQGWRNYSSQNLGPKDLYHPYRDSTDLRTARWHSDDDPTPLKALLAQDWICNPERACIISHDGVPDNSADPLVEVLVAQA